VLREAALVDERMDRQQLDRGHAQALQMLDDRRRREAGVGAAQRLGD
jgi:hypothetical protein